MDPLVKNQRQPSQPHEYQFTEQLSQMLYGLGDFPGPSPDTIRLLEDYLRLRLGRWAQSAAAAAAGRQGGEVTPEALVAALRSNKRALAQAVIFHRLLAGVPSSASLRPDGDGGGGGAFDETSVQREIDGDYDDDESAASDLEPQLPSYVESAAAEAGAELSQLQAERQARMLRLARCSETLSDAHYARFARCRRCSLLSRISDCPVPDYARFRRWLGPAGERLSGRACRLLSYLGGQAVAELLDLVKQRRAESWPADALALESEICASPAEIREAMQLRRQRLS